LEAKVIRKPISLTFLQGFKRSKKKKPAVIPSRAIKMVPRFGTMFWTEYPAFSN